MSALSDQPGLPEAFPLNLLPEPVLILVLEQLSAENLCAVSTVCSEWYAISQRPHMWSNLYYREFLVHLSDEPSDPSSWKQQFIKTRREFVAFNGAVQSQPENALSWSRRGRQHEENKHYRAAILDLTEAIKRGPTLGHLADILMIRASALRELGKTEEAFRDNEAAVAANPENDNLVCAVGMIYSDAGLIEKSVNIFDMGLKHSPECLSFHYWKGDSLAANKLYDEAIAAFDMALGLAQVPSNISQILRTKAKVYFDLKRPAEGFQVFDRAVEICPDDHLSLFERAKKKLDFEKYEEAYEDCTKAAELQEEALYYSYRSRAGFHLRNLGQALIDARKAADISNVEAHELGICLYAIGRTQQALVALDACVKGQAYEFDGCKVRGTDLDAVKLFDRAMADFDKAIELAPWNSGYYWRGLLKLQCGDVKRAWNDLEKAHKATDPPLARVDFWLGVVKLLLGNKGEVEALFDASQANCGRLSGPVLSIGRISEPARITLMRTRSFEQATELYLPIFTGYFGDSTCTEKYYLKLLTQLFPERTEIAAVSKWFRLKFNEAFQIDAVRQMLSSDQQLVKHS